VVLKKYCATAALIARTAAARLRKGGAGQADEPKELFDGAHGRASLRKCSRVEKHSSPDSCASIIMSEAAIVESFSESRRLHGVVIAMLETDPFLLSATETATTEAMRAMGRSHKTGVTSTSLAERGDFRQDRRDWRPDMRFSTAATRRNKRGKVVFGPEASKRINERASEIYALFSAAANEAEADAVRTMRKPRR